MSETEQAQLTSEQEDLLSFTRQKWSNIVFSTESISRQKVILAIQEAYRVLDQPMPEVIFCDSPVAAFEKIVLDDWMQQKITNLINNFSKKVQRKFSDPRLIELSWSDLNKLTKEVTFLLQADIVNQVKELLNLPPSPLNELDSYLMGEIRNQLSYLRFEQVSQQFSELDLASMSQLERKLYNQLISRIFNHIFIPLDEQVGRFLKEKLGQELGDQTLKSFVQTFWVTLKDQVEDNLMIDYFQFQFWATHVGLFEFTIEELGCQVEQRQWQAFQKLVKECGGIYVTYDTCFVCDRPCLIIRDEPPYIKAVFTDGVTLSSEPEENTVNKAKETITPQTNTTDNKTQKKPKTVQKSKETILQSKQTVTQSKSTMLQDRISEIDPEKLKQFKIYLKRWDKIMISRPKTDVNQLKQAIEKGYTSLFNPVPNVITYKSFEQLISELELQAKIEELLNYVSYHIARQLRREVTSQLRPQESHKLMNDLSELFSDDINQKISKIWENHFSYPLLNKIQESLEKQLDYQIDIEVKKKLIKMINEHLANLAKALKQNQSNDKIIFLDENLIKFFDDIYQYIENYSFLGEQEFGTPAPVKSEIKTFVNQVKISKIKRRDFARVKFINFYVSCALFDFCINELGCTFNTQLWESFKFLIIHHIWITGTENICLIANVQSDSNYQLFQAIFKQKSNFKNQVSAPTITNDLESDTLETTIPLSFDFINIFIKLIYLILQKTGLLFYWSVSEAYKLLSMLVVFSWKMLKPVLNWLGLNLIIFGQDLSYEAQVFLKKFSNEKNKFNPKFIEAFKYDEIKEYVEQGYRKINLEVPKIIFKIDFNQFFDNIKNQTNVDKNDQLFPFLYDSYLGGRSNFSFLSGRLCFSLDSMHRLKSWEFIQGPISTQSQLEVVWQDIVKDLILSFHTKLFKKIRQYQKSLAQNLALITRSESFYIFSDTMPNGLMFYYTLYQDNNEAAENPNYSLLVYWIIPFQTICMVVPIPITIYLDRAGELHKEKEPALKIGSSWQYYYHHGTLIPKQYGQIHPNQWPAKWILKERRSLIRQLLINEIGYARICQELPTRIINTWREYTLLEVRAKIDLDPTEPVYVLKMVCPSTKMTHALRVPPSMRSAREAIRWANWGEDPQAFNLES